MALQGYKSTAVDSTGNVLSGVLIEVRRASDGAIVSLFDARAAGAPLSNPFNAEVSGDFEFFTYESDLVVTLGAGTSPQKFPVALRELGYSGRDDFVEAVAGGMVLDDGVVVVAGGVSYQSHHGATDIADLPGWIPATFGVSPAHFGAISGVGADQSSAIQSACDFVRSSWNSANVDWDRELDFFGEVFRADGSIDFSGIRQPRIKARNGQLYSKAAGKIAFDCTLTNNIIIDDFIVYGDAISPPDWGIYIGRGLINGDYPGVDGCEFRGDTGCQGYFARGGILMFAAEVTRWTSALFLYNKHRSVDAVTVAVVDNMRTISDRFGSETFSDFQTLPSGATGNHSNTVYDFGPANIRRAADFNLTVTSISKANPAVVTVSTGTLAGAGLSNGDNIFISSGDMPEVAYSVFTVANINEGSDTFELSGVDSTSYTTYTSGATIQNQTGSPLLTSGLRTAAISAGYLLSYGSPNIVTDLNEGGAPSDWCFQMQSERVPATIAEFLCGSGEVVCPHLKMSLTNTGQTNKAGVFSITGGGNVQLYGGFLTISNMGTAPAELMSPIGHWRGRGFDIDVPLAAALPAAGAMLEYSGIQTARDREPAARPHGMTIEAAPLLQFAENNISQTQAGLRANSSDTLFFYKNDAAIERQVQVNDVSSAGSFNQDTANINIKDKYQGKMAWDVTTGRPVFSTGSGPTSTWVDAAGVVVYTPV